MSQFMQQKRDEEQDRRRHGQAQDNAIAPLRIAGMKLGGKRKHNQEGDEKPAIVQPNFDSKDSSELNLRSQVGYLLPSIRPPVRGPTRFNLRPPSTVLSFGAPFQPLSLSSTTNA